MTEQLGTSPPRSANSHRDDEGPPVPINPSRQKAFAMGNAARLAEIEAKLKRIEGHIPTDLDETEWKGLSAKQVAAYLPLLREALDIRRPNWRGESSKFLDELRTKNVES